MAANAGFMTLDGTFERGEDVRTQNVTACLALANIVKTSLGPVGLDKMLVDQLGDVTITNDGATILKQLDVEHPAAKVMVQLSHLQDREVGDGTTSVVIIAAELLRRANELVRQKVHPTIVMSGYRLAMRAAIRKIKSWLVFDSEALGREVLVNSAKTCLSSKILGAESDLFSNMVVDAVLAVKMETAAGEVKYPVSAISILKCHGRSSVESELVDGFALNCTRSAQGMPKQVPNAKVALLGFNLQRHRLQMGVSVLVKDPAELEKIKNREIEITKERIQKIIAGGANVIMTSEGIDDLCAKFMVEAGVMGIRRVKKRDLRHIARATGGQLMLSLADLEGGETLNPEYLGTCAEVVEERVGDSHMIYVRGSVMTKATTIVMRGANEFMLDEMERSMHDALMVVKRVLETKKVVPGGGCTEAAISVHLEDYAKTLGSKEQEAVYQFSQALLVIPTTLAVNAAVDAADLVAQLRAAHYESQQPECSVADQERLKLAGLDLVAGEVVNNLQKGVVEPALSKLKQIRFATEAAVTIMRIDDMITINPKQAGPPGGRQ